MELDTLLEKLEIGEGQDFECKAAEDNLPKDLWPGRINYSWFINVRS